jgi:hypothetical protein
MQIDLDFWFPLPSPSEFMYQTELIGGSGKRALEEGRITREAYDGAVALWKKHLVYLKNHQPTLIHTSPFLWTIYLQREGNEWSVTKLTPMSELMWWDPAYNLCFLQYPPFGEYCPSQWNAFLRGYGSEPDRKRVLLYLLMQRLCAAMGVFKAPTNARNIAWAQSSLTDFSGIVDEISQL